MNSRTLQRSIWEKIVDFVFPTSETKQNSNRSYFLFLSDSQKQIIHQLNTFKTLLMMLNQCFLTAVQRHTYVPQDFLSAQQNLKVLHKVSKNSNILVFFNIYGVRQFFFQVYRGLVKFENHCVKHKCINPFWNTCQLIQGDRLFY